MPDQRYAPPAAAVKDVAHERALAERPRQVRAALLLLWAGIVIGLPVMYYEYTSAASRASTAAVLVLLVFGVVFTLLAILYYLIGQGRNWARIAYLLFTLWSFYMFFTSIGELAAKPGYVILLEVLGTMTDLVAIPLLFFGAGAHWFRTMREQG